jgi:hypothetical protein
MSKYQVESAVVALGIVAVAVCLVTATRCASLDTCYAKCRPGDNSAASAACISACQGYPPAVE